jgi:hypothetical protein
MKQKNAWTTPHQPPGKPRGYMSRNPAMGSPKVECLFQGQSQLMPHSRGSLINFGEYFACCTHFDRHVLSFAWQDCSYVA